jgi:hypothetical protein
MNGIGPTYRWQQSLLADQPRDLVMLGLVADDETVPKPKSYRADRGSEGIDLVGETGYHNRQVACSQGTESVSCPSTSNSTGPRSRSSEIFGSSIKGASPKPSKSN